MPIEIHGSQKFIKRQMKNNANAKMIKETVKYDQHAKKNPVQHILCLLLSQSLLFQLYQIHNGLSLWNFHGILFFFPSKMNLILSFSEVKVTKYILERNKIYYFQVIHFISTTSMFKSVILLI
ncbi:unnamed protein product [Paramecium primaurelia]|uniref:Uncharacterized protein n=1 Tax=Paramecium primaurelia TaxID=5886 RepID=A0A8S1P491_PARPR|nr:unnamed protein product [Paramecium primaurelia]